MPKLFGEKNPEINDTLAIKLFSFFDARTVVVYAKQVNKDWKRIIDKEDFKEIKKIYQYRIMMNNKIFRFCPELQNETPDSMAVKPLSGGWTNMTFFAKNASHQYVIRFAGNNTNVLIDREKEEFNARIVSECGVNPKVIYSEAKSGVQVTTFINKPIAMSQDSFKDFSNIKRILQPLKKMHNSGRNFSNTTDIFARNKFMHEWLEKNGVHLSEEYAFAANKMQELEKLIQCLNITKVPCHNDTTPSNFIYSSGNSKDMYMIDWEYSGNNDPVWDLAYFAREADLTPEGEKYLISVYYDDQNQSDSLPSIRFQLYKPMVEYWISLWTHIQIVNNNHVAGLDTLLKYERTRIKQCKELFESANYNKALEQLKESTVIPFQSIAVF